MDSKLVPADTGLLHEHIGLTGYTSTSASLPVAGRISLPSRLVFSFTLFADRRRILCFRVRGPYLL